EAMQRMKEHEEAARKQAEEFHKQVEAQQEQVRQKIQLDQEANQKRSEEIRAKVHDSMAKATGGETGKYWLGVSCREASPDLRAQLGLEDGQGIVVVNVAPDSAAAKRGLKQHDVIVKINDTRLAHVPDLSKVVNEADGKGVSLVIIRGGKEQTVDI